MSSSAVRNTITLFLLQLHVARITCTREQTSPHRSLPLPVRLCVMRGVDLGGRWCCQACVYFMFPPNRHSKAGDTKKKQRSADRANNVIIGNTCKVADGRFQTDASPVTRSRPPIWRAGVVVVVGGGHTVTHPLSASAKHTHLYSCHCEDIH